MPPSSFEFTLQETENTEQKVGQEKVSDHVKVLHWHSWPAFLSKLSACFLLNAPLITYTGCQKNTLSTTNSSTKGFFWGGDTLHVLLSLFYLLMLSQRLYVECCQNNPVKGFWGYKKNKEIKHIILKYFKVLAQTKHYSQEYVSLQLRLPTVTCYCCKPYGFLTDMSETQPTEVLLPSQG